MKNSDALWIYAGQIGRIIGLDGWMRVHSITQPKELIFQCQPWRLYRHHDELDGSILSFHAHDETLMRVQLFEPSKDRHLNIQRARHYTQFLIGVARSDLPVIEPGNGYYFSDLIGLSVYDISHQPHRYLGDVVTMESMVTQDLMYLSSQLYIPFVEPAIVKQVDLVHRIIQVDWGYDI